MRTPTFGHHEIVVITLVISSNFIPTTTKSSRTLRRSNLNANPGLISSSTPPPTPALQYLYSKMFLCNNGTIHQCRCVDISDNHFTETLRIPPCFQLIQEEGLNVLNLQWPLHNLTKWHRNETYERFFKRQIATIVSRYCEQQANKCRGAYLRIEEGNIIILKVENTGHRKMNLTFVVAKDPQLQELTTKRIMNSTKIRALLIQKKKELKYAFSGVILSNATVSVITLENKVEDNTRLLTLVSLVGFFFTVTYLIAAVKVCRDHYYKKQAKRRVMNRTVVENVPDYGSCEETPRVKTQNINDSQLLNHSSNSPEFLDLAVRIAEPSPSSVDERSIRRMFECDPSQLPAEQPLWSQNSSLEESSPGPSYETNEKYKDNPGPKVRIEPCDSTEQIVLPNIKPQRKSDDNKNLMPRIKDHKNVAMKAFGSTGKYLSKLIAEPQVIRSRTAHELGNWSSDSEDEQNDIYYRLSEADEEDSKDLNSRKKTDSDSEADAEILQLEPDSSFETMNLYQRLEETPPPFPNNSNQTSLV